MNEIQDSACERLLRCLPGRLNISSPEMLLSDLALDSLDTVEFLCAVHEEFGVRLTDAHVLPGQTLRGLAHLLQP